MLIQRPVGCRTTASVPGEQIYYSARLRNAEGTPKAAIEHIVEDVLNVMQLLDVQHSIVGDVEKRGISGGQRKRVNIGVLAELECKIQTGDLCEIIPYIANPACNLKGKGRSL